MLILSRLIKFVNTGPIKQTFDHDAVFPAILQPHTTGIILSNIINSGGKIGVCIFFMISGYFSIKGTFTTQKMFKLWKVVLFYSILSFGMECIPNLSSNFGLFINHDKTNLGIHFFADLITRFFPVIHSQFWFITAYLIVLAMSPFINEYLQKISKRKFLFLLISWSVLYYTINTWLVFGSFPPNEGGSLGQLSNISLSIPVCILFYITGAYFRLHPPPRTKRTVTIFTLLGLASFLPILVCCYNGILQKGYAFYRLDRPHVILISIPIFLVFSLMKIEGGPAKVINALSKNVLEVYLFHMALFAVFMFTVKNLIVKIPGFDPAYWFTFSKLVVFGFFFSILVFFLCIGFAEIRSRIARAFFSLRPLQTAKTKFVEFLG